MASHLSRTATFAALSVGSLSVAYSPWGGVAFFLAVALVAATITDGAVFDALSTPVDVEDGRLRTVISFALTGGALAALLPAIGLPSQVYVATMLAVGFGDLGRHGVDAIRPGPVPRTAGFVFLGGVAAILGQVLFAMAVGDTVVTPSMLFVGASGAFLGALLRSILFARNDPLVLGFMAVLLWLLASLSMGVGWETVAIAIGISMLFGALSIAMETASIPGMLTGVFLSLLAVVLGGFGWFAVLMAFFGIGGLSTKYQYEAKVKRGVAEPNEGARGTGNVLGNSLASLVALLLFASHAHIPVPGPVLVYAFVGSVATALADTLSSEIGGLYDRPRLLTTLETVEPGTDGAITWQGELAGVTGAALIGGLAVYALPIPTVGIGVVIGAGLVGMTVDSIAGATIEGTYIGNQAVNFLATSAGGVAGALLAFFVI